MTSTFGAFFNATPIARTRSLSSVSQRSAIRNNTTPTFHESRPLQRQRQKVTDYQQPRSNQQRNPSTHKESEQHYKPPRPIHQQTQLTFNQPPPTLQQTSPNRHHEKFLPRSEPPLIPTDSLRDQNDPRYAAKKEKLFANLINESNAGFLDDGARNRLYSYFEGILKQNAKTQPNTEEKKAEETDTALKKMSSYIMSEQKINEVFKRRSEDLAPSKIRYFQMSSEEEPFCFSGYHPFTHIYSDGTPFEENGKTFASVEIYVRSMLCQELLDIEFNPNELTSSFKKYLDTRSGRTLSRQVTEQWYLSRGLMYYQRGIILYLIANPDTEKMLRNTRNRLLVYTFSKDSFLGAGIDMNAIKAFRIDMGSLGMSCRYPMTYPLKEDDLWIVPLLLRGYNVLGSFYMAIRHRLQISTKPLDELLFQIPTYREDVTNNICRNPPKRPFRPHFEVREEKQAKRHCDNNSRSSSGYLSLDISHENISVDTNKNKNNILSTPNTIFNDMNLNSPIVQRVEEMPEEHALMIENNRNEAMVNDSFKAPYPDKRNILMTPSRHRIGSFTAPSLKAPYSNSPPNAFASYRSTSQQYKSSESLRSNQTSTPVNIAKTRANTMSSSNVSQISRMAESISSADTLRFVHVSEIRDGIQDKDIEEVQREVEMTEPFQTQSADRQLPGIRQRIPLDQLPITPPRPSPATRSFVVPPKTPPIPSTRQIPPPKTPPTSEARLVQKTQTLKKRFALFKKPQPPKKAMTARAAGGCYSDDESVISIVHDEIDSESGSRSDLASVTQNTQQQPEPTENRVSPTMLFRKVGGTRPGSAQNLNSSKTSTETLSERRNGGGKFARRTSLSSSQTSQEAVVAKNPEGQKQTSESNGVFKATAIPSKNPIPTIELSNPAQPNQNDFQTKHGFVIGSEEHRDYVNQNAMDELFDICGVSVVSDLQDETSLLSGPHQNFNLTPEEELELLGEH